MSNSASIAAAKKRRSQPVVNTKTTSQQQRQQQNSINQEKISPLNLLQKHDFKLFTLEKNLELLKENLVTKKDLESFEVPENSNSKVNNSLENNIQNNNNEISSLKLITNKLLKEQSEANSMIQTLHASLLTQTNIINELKQLKLDFNKFIEDSQKNNEENGENGENEESTQDIEEINASIKENITFSISNSLSSEA
jgi:hypothetical protein